MTALNSGRIDDDIQSAQNLHSLLKTGNSLLMGGNIDLQALAVKALGTEISRNRLHLCTGAENNHSCTGFHQALGHAVTETAGTARNDCSPAFDIKQIHFFFSYLFIFQN